MRSFFVLTPLIAMLVASSAAPLRAQPTPPAEPPPATGDAAPEEPSEEPTEAPPAAPDRAPASPAAPATPAEPDAVPPTGAEPVTADPGAAEPAADSEGEQAPTALPEPRPADVEAEPQPGLEPAPLALPATEPAPGSDVGDVPSPGEMSDRLAAGLEESYDGEDTWTAPTPVFTLHGYMRMRGELMDTFWLGRLPHVPFTADLERLNNLLPAGEPDIRQEALGPDPFSRFRAFERRPAPGGGDRGNVCVDEGGIAEAGASDLCEVDTIQFANLRLRLSPELNVTEDVRVRATFDVLDNLIAGSAPASYYGSSPPLAPFLADTDLPAGGGGGNSIVARRAWAEVRNRDLGELRFGRMPQHWGLGMVFNNGNGLDHDFSTDLDRVLGITKLAGFYLSASYDFIAEGPVAPTNTFRPDLDGSQLDDVDQFSFSVARLLSEEEQSAALERGELVFNFGVHFTLRHQDAVLITSPDNTDEPVLATVDSTRYTPDLWAQLLMPGVRIETELAFHLGNVQRPSLMNDGQELDLTSFGGVLETEFRFLEDKLALYFNTGLATGDQDVEGLSAGTDFTDQQSPDDTVSTFSFHPSYQVDMILWRNIMRQVTGAYYFKPGVSYDFVRTAFGELFGARLDVVWSRASSFVQAPGNSSNLGLELNAQVYWRSEDGADPDDGYHASIQYGVLFPMAGLGFPDYRGLSQSLDTAQQVRLLLGVVF